MAAANSCASFLALSSAAFFATNAAASASAFAFAAASAAWHAALQLGSSTGATGVELTELDATESPIALTAFK